MAKVNGTIFVQDCNGYSKIWKKLTNIPAIDGQKYTIGERFISREEQGEFIFWTNNKKRRETPDPSDFEIIWIKKHYWLTPIGKDAIFINNVEVNKKSRLEFGDVISLGGIVPDQSGDSYQTDNIVGILKLQREKEHPKVKRKTNNAPRYSTATDGWKETFPVVNNALIVSLILGFFNLKQLKKVRLVNRMWSEEAIKIIKKRAVVNLNFAEGSDDHTYMRFLRYSTDMKDNPLASWKIGFSNEGAKLVSDLDWFLGSRNFGELRKLNLVGFVDSQLDFEMRVKILGKVGKSLEHLEFGGYLSFQLKHDFPEKIKFPKLVGFTLSMRKMGYPPYTPDFSWLQALLSSIQGVKRLHLKGDYPPPSVIFLENLTKFVKLEDITLPAEEGWKYLQGLNRPLKRISLEGVPILKDSMDVLAFERILAKFSKSLQHLHLELPVCSAGQDEVVHVQEYPLLKVLNVAWKYTDSNSSSKSLGIKLSFKNSDGQDVDYVEYGKHFPSLQALTFNTSENAFYPEEETVSQICKTVVELDIPRKLRNPRNLQLSRIAKLFPNVQNDWINSARD